MDQGEAQTRLRGLLDDPGIPEADKAQAVNLYRQQFASPPSSLQPDVSGVPHAASPDSGAYIPTPRQALGYAGGAALAVPTLLSGSGALGTGAAFLGGQGVAHDIYDIKTGKAGQVGRKTLAALGTAAADRLVGGRFRTGRAMLDISRRLLAGALGGAAAGQVADVALDRVSGVPDPDTTLGAKAQTVGEDALAGAVQSGATQWLQRRQTARQTADDARYPGRGPYTAQQRRSYDTFARDEGLSRTAGDRTGSPTLATMEKLPTLTPWSRRDPLLFRARQLGELDQSLERRLTRLERATQSGNTRAARTVARTEVRRVRDEFRTAAETGYAWERQALATAQGVDEGQVTVPLQNLKTTVENVRANFQRQPEPIPGQVERAGEQAGVVLFDDLGSPVTVDMLANLPAMEWATARRYLAKLGVGINRRAQVGTVDDGIRKQLAGALRADLDAVLAQHPDVADGSRWVDEAYGRAKDRLNGSLRQIAQTAGESGANDSAFWSNLFQADNPGKTTELREMVDPDVWQQLTTGWLRHVASGHRVAPRAGGVGPDGQPLTVFNPNQFAARLDPYIRSGQLDEMFDPETATYLKRFAGYVPSVNQAEQLAGNPSGTGQAVSNVGSAMKVMESVGALAAAPAAVVGGGAALGLPMVATGLGGLATAVGAPRWAGHLLYQSPRTQNALTQLFTPATDERSILADTFAGWLARGGLEGIPGQRARGAAPPSAPPPAGPTGESAPKEGVASDPRFAQFPDMATAADAMPPHVTTTPHSPYGNVPEGLRRARSRLGFIDTRSGLAKRVTEQLIRQGFLTPEQLGERP